MLVVYRVKISFSGGCIYKRLMLWLCVSGVYSLKMTY